MCIFIYVVAVLSFVPLFMLKFLMNTATAATDIKDSLTH